jgi:hypothetical protein
MERFKLPDDLDKQYLMRGLQRMGISHVFKGSVQETRVDIKWRDQTVHLEFFVWQRNPGLPVYPGDNGTLFTIAAGDIRDWDQEESDKSSQIQGDADNKQSNNRRLSLITRDRQTPSPALWIYKGEYEEGKNVRVPYQQLARHLDKASPPSLQVL